MREGRPWTNVVINIIIIMLFAWASVVSSFSVITMFSFHTLFRRFLLRNICVIESQVLLGARFPSHQENAHPPPPPLHTSRKRCCERMLVLIMFITILARLKRD